MKKTLLLTTTLLFVFLTGRAQFCESPVGFGQNAGLCAGAQNVVVLNLNDGGAGSLREALELPGAMKITFAVSGTIVLHDDILSESCKYIDGAGQNIIITRHGIEFDNKTNCIVRNISFIGDGQERKGTGDAITVYGGSEHIWIDHCSFSNYYDGLVDITKGSNKVTVSYCHFYNHNKTMLIGASDGQGNIDKGRLKVTVHHNLFEGTRQRHPRLRFGKVHVLNNYFRHISSYGTAACLEGEMLMENNIFENVHRPNEHCAGGGGFMNERGNWLINSGIILTSGTTFEPSSYYSYTANTADQLLKNIIETYKGANTTTNLKVNRNGNDLIAPLAFSYQWFLNGNLISGANQQKYTAAKIGNYTVKIYGDNNCFKELNIHVATLAPIGFVENANCGLISGFGFDPDMPDFSIDAHIYVDGKFAGVAPTDKLNAAQNNQYGINGLHGFIWDIPAAYQDGQTHLVEVYFLNYPYGTGNNPKVWSGNIGPCEIGVPLGKVEAASCFKVSGWAFDPELADESVIMHIYVDGKVEAGITMDITRPDINQLYAINGDHGFSWNVPTKFRDGKSHLIEAYILNYPYQLGVYNPKIFSGWVGACPTGDPVGHIDHVSCTKINGWAYDPDIPYDELILHAYVDGKMAAAINTNHLRSDVNTNMGISGNHGFEWMLPAIYRDGKSHTVDIYALNFPYGSGLNNPKLYHGVIGPCANLEPVAYVDDASCNAIRGWAYDPDIPHNELILHAYVDGKEYASFSTDQMRSDVNQYFGISGKHGFNWIIPAEFKDGNTHYFEIYTLNFPYGSGLNNPKILAKVIGPCSANSPIGTIETLSCGKVEGWAFDPDDVNTSIEVQLYLDGILQETSATDVYRNDINQSMSISGNHGFAYNLENMIDDGQMHTITLYAVENDKSAGGNIKIGEGNTACDPQTNVEEKNNVSDTPSQLFPNPMKENLTFTFELKEASKIQIEIMDVLGKASTLYEVDQLRKGQHEMNFNLTAFDLPSGLYFIRLKTSEKEFTSKVIKE